MASREWLEEFITMYRNEPCLWQIKSKAYRDQRERDKSYSKLVEKLKEIDKNADEEAVKKKINCIRTTYKKQLRRVEASIKSGDERIYSPKLWYYPLLQFLHDEDRPRTRRSDTEDDHSDYEDPIDVIKQAPKAEIFIYPEEAGPESTSTLKRRASTVPASNAAIREPKKRNLDSFNKSRTETVRDSLPAHNDRFDIFGANVAAKLRDLSKRQRIFAENLINETLFEAEMDNLTVTYRVMDSAGIIHSPSPCDSS
uniref:MADF domain-containing protein n=1 Tax=Heliothis virescens TaxID=7102 RepID=A0A2A4JLJ7_HELVI